MIYRLSIYLFQLAFASAAMASDWLSEPPVSFYETQVDNRQLTEAVNAHTWLSYQAVDEPVSPTYTRPYGFGRELSDQSPANYSGLKRDALYFFGYQLAYVGALYTLSNDKYHEWREDQSWKENVSNPTWDPDEWTYNYIYHPYWGMAYYTRGRERGLTEMDAFWYSFALSSMFEFGLEAFFEAASVQDLILTPVLGSALGWYLEGIRREIKARRTFSTWDKTLLIATDPLGSLNQVVDNLIGWREESQLRLRSFLNAPYATHSEEGFHESSPNQTDNIIPDYVGLELTLHWQ